MVTVARSTQPGTHHPRRQSGHNLFRQEKILPEAEAKLRQTSRTHKLSLGCISEQLADGSGIISIQYIDTNEQAADIFTKHCHHRGGIRRLSYSASGRRPPSCFKISDSCPRGFFRRLRVQPQVHWWSRAPHTVAPVDNQSLVCTLDFCKAGTRTPCYTPFDMEVANGA